MSLLFPVKCSLLNPQSLPFVAPVLLSILPQGKREKEWVSEGRIVWRVSVGALNWRVPFLTMTQSNQGSFYCWLNASETLVHFCWLMEPSSLDTTLGLFSSSFSKVQVLLEFFTLIAHNPSRTLETLQRNNGYAQVSCITCSWDLKICRMFCGRLYTGFLTGKRNEIVEFGDREVAGKKTLQ